LGFWGFGVLGIGNYNFAFIDETRENVLKVQHTIKDKDGKTDKDAKIDEPSRSIRLWNEINSELTPAAKIVTHTLKGKSYAGLPVEVDIGWTCPFIKGRESTQLEIKSSLIDIFNRTGRVILDAIARDNFKTTAEGKVICIDIDLN
jgi:hypothetical protein